VVVASARGLRTSGLGLSSELSNLGGMMGRYNIINRLRWRDVAMEEDVSSFHLFFQTRKNAQSRKGDKVNVACFPHGQYGSL